MFKKGAKVTQVVTAPISGVVDGFAVDQETGEVLVRVSYTNDAEESHLRYFRDSELAEAKA